MPLPDLATIKTALKIDYTYDDAEIIRLRDAAIAFIEDYCGISIADNTHNLYISYWMKTRFDIQPFASVNYVNYVDSTGATVTMPSTDYFLIRSHPPSVYINFKEFPSIYEDTEILINYNTGYDELPDHITQAIIAITGAWYNNPESTAPITLTEVPLSARFILENLKSRSVLE
jgi:uncharacterized phiE125 gp8 family phage protein